MEIYDVIIIGAGPAGLTASIYASRYKLSNLVIGKQIGGEFALAHKVDNYPGYMGISGMELAEKWKEQAEALGAKVLLKEVAKIDISTDSLVPRKFTIIINESKIYESKALIVATGSERRRLNILGEKEYLGRGVSYCTTCLPPGEEVVANNSLKKIEELGIVNRVLTKDGSYQNINQIIARDYEGELVKIKTAYFTESVKLTTNHPVLISKIKRDYYRKKLTLSKPTWEKAGELDEKDWVLYPIVQKVDNVKFIKPSELLQLKTKEGRVVLNQETHSSLRIADKVNIDKKFLRLAGYYMAEGSITYHGVNFYFNKEEKEYINDTRKLIKEIFGLEPFFKIEGSVGRICIFSKLVSNLFEVLFGKYAPYKKIPHWMIFLPLEKQKELIKGIYRGDGCLREKDFCIVTSSRTLAYQLRDILLRFSVIASIQRRKKKKLNQNPSEIGKRKIRFKHDKYHVVIGGASLEKMSEILNVQHPKINKRTRISKFALIRNNYLYLPIREINRENFRGRVYNLSVANNNTYVAKNFIVHNCDAPFFKGKIVALIGGNDSAVSGAVHTAEFASKVYLIYRGDAIRAEPIWQEEWKKIESSGKGTTIYNTNLTEILGDGKQVTGVKLSNPYNNSQTLKLDGVFVEIGGVPGTALVQNLGVKVDETGHVMVDENMATNIPGLYCAGDMVSKSSKFKQAIWAMSQGAMAANNAYQFIKKTSAPMLRGV